MMKYPELGVMGYDEFEQAIEVADKWRCNQDDERCRTTGIVRVWDGQVYGWAAELGQASTERRGALAVGVRGSVWVAVGGTAEAGAQAWREITDEIRAVSDEGGPQFAAAAGRDITGELHKELGDDSVSSADFFAVSRKVRGPKP